MPGQLRLRSTVGFTSASGSASKNSRFTKPMVPAINSAGNVAMLVLSRSDSYLITTSHLEEALLRAQDLSSNQEKGIDQRYIDEFLQLLHEALDRKKGLENPEKRLRQTHRAKFKSTRLASPRDGGDSDSDEAISHDIHSDFDDGNASSRSWLDSDSDDDSNPFWPPPIRGPRSVSAFPGSDSDPDAHRGRRAAQISAMVVESSDDDSFSPALSFRPARVTKRRRKVSRESRRNARLGLGLAGGSHP